jgi:hypothetical protein
MKEQLYIHFTNLEGARKIRSSGVLLKSSYVDAIFAVAMGGQYVPDVQRSSLGRAKTRNVAIYFTTQVMPDYCRPEECVWHGDSIPVKIKKIGFADNAVKDLDGSLEVDPEDDHLIGVETIETRKGRTVFSLSEVLNVLEAPEASASDVFGVSFDDPNKKKPEFRPAEPNTNSELRLLSAIDSWFAGQPPRNLGTALMTQVKPAIDAGKYPQLKPAPGYVYRGMSLSTRQFQEIVKLSSQEITEKPATSWYVGSPGILLPYGKNKLAVSSWTLDPKIAIGFSTAGEEGFVYVVFVADTRNPKNNFFLNPEKLRSLYQYRTARVTGGTPSPFISAQSKDEKEVLGVGAIEFKEFVFYLSPKDEIDTMSWKKVKEMPEWPAFSTMLAQNIRANLSPKSIFNTNARIDLTNQAIIKTMNFFIRKMKWNSIGSTKSASDGLRQLIRNTKYDYPDLFVPSTKTPVETMVEKWIKIVLREIEREEGVFPKNGGIYDPVKSMLYSLGLVKKEPKPERF